MIQNEISHALAQMTAQDSSDGSVTCNGYRGCQNTGTVLVSSGLLICQECVDRHKQELLLMKQRAFNSCIERHEKIGVVFPDGFLDMKCDPVIRDINPEAWVVAKEWDVDKNVYIYGPVGVGKTYMANLMILHCLKKDRNGRKDIYIISARRLCKISDRFDEGKGLLKYLEDADVLLLDDLDKGNWNTERLGALWELLDVRSAAKRFTIVTANVSAKDIREVLRASTGGNTSLADATLDRMKPCLTIQLNGRSLR